MARKTQKETKISYKQNEITFYPQIEECLNLIPNLDKNFELILNKILEKSIENGDFINVVYKTLNSVDLQKFKNQYKKVLERRKEFVNLINGDLKEETDKEIQISNVKTLEVDDLVEIKKNTETTKKEIEERQPKKEIKNEKNTSSFGFEEETF